ncbi:putative bifunctional diguanylate cyclase/phosphodiesterase [Cognatilysobacter lacus]|uniref:putative bifunctional diguanylate cyclase/phosphodiesterase n=1 Tax=Cognatilysobacter lacus TaxID=1643323 RepID=UPI0016597C22|nr:bifunctional diguanylate cyclase/phosphodiesterase [Lysobacter lacus]
MAADDELTGLRGRRDFLSLLGRQVVHASENRASVALVVVDIDGFAEINGVHGYALGDRLLAHLARQLQSVLRPQDYAARIGDNRFALIFSNVLNAGHVELAVQKLFRLLDTPVEAGAARLHVPVTLGVALCPRHATHSEFLLRRAEAALMRARRLGARHAFAPDTGADLDISDQWDLEMQLGTAIERGEMLLAYQPKVSASTLQPVGAEALMRWNSGTRGAISPDVFIPVAERIGHIKKLTVWALNTSLRHASQWTVPCGRPSVSVNIPGVLATQPDLPELVEDALRLWGDGVQLVLEITEGSLMDAAVAFPILQRVRAMGVQISIDDFGTGYSCLSYFRNIPADELKIDRSFVTGLLTDPAYADIIRFVVDLAHRFGLSVAAEGVEDEATSDRLRELGCDVLQGFLFGRPVPNAEVQAWLTAQQPVFVARG